MNKALNYYKDDENIMAITAFSHKHATKNYKHDIIFTYAFYSWGWETWKSKWGDINWNECDISWYNKSLKHKIISSVYSWFQLFAINKAVKIIIKFNRAYGMFIILLLCIREKNYALGLQNSLLQII